MVVRMPAVNKSDASTIFKSFTNTFSIKELYKNEGSYEFDANVNKD